MEHIKSARRFYQDTDQTSSSLSYRKRSSLFLLQKHSFLLLSIPRSFNLSTVLPSTHWLGNTTSDQSFHRVSFDLSLGATIFIQVFPFVRDHAQRVS